MGAATVGEQISSGVCKFKSGLRSAGQALQALPQAAGHAVVDSFQRGGGALDAGIVGMKQAAAQFGRQTGAGAGTGSYKAPADVPKTTQAEPVSPKKSGEAVAFVYKMMTLIDFPGEHNLKEVGVGIVGNEQMYAESSKALEGKMIRGRRVHCVKVTDPSKLKEMGLSVLYLGPNCDVQKYLDNAPKEGLFTVDSSLPNTNLKADARIVEANGHLRVHLNVDENRRQKLKLSPRLVKVAARLYSDRGLEYTR